jgi:hypothetical protein
LDPDRCSFKDDQKARNQRVANHARQIGKFEDVNSPIFIAREGAMEEDPLAKDRGTSDRHNIHAGLPSIGSGGRAHAEGTTTGPIEANTTTSGVTPPTVITHLRFGTQEPPTIPSGLEV